MRIRMLLAGLLTTSALMLAGCSGGSSVPEPVAATPAADAPTADALVADGTNVPTGEWGVLRYMSTEDEETLFALRIGTVVAGEQGDLDDVTNVSGGSLDGVTPYYVNYSWTVLSGDEWFAPALKLAVIAPSDALALSVPASLEACADPLTADGAPEIGYEYRNCLVVASDAGAPESLVFYGPEGSSVDVSLDVPDVQD